MIRLLLGQVKIIIIKNVHIYTSLARINYRNNFNRMKEKHVLGSNIFKRHVCTIVVFPSLSAQLDITY